VLTSALIEQGCYTDYGVSGYGVSLKLSRTALMSQTAVRDMAEAMMLSIADRCMELGASAIGHIKSFIRTEAGDIKADTIGIAHGAYSAGQISHAVKVLNVAVNTVVMGIPESAVKAATLEGIHQVADKGGLSVVKEREHSYFDEFDAVVTKFAIEEPYGEYDFAEDDL
jgi:hypothetical protein